MKKIILTLFLLLTSFSVYAEEPEIPLTRAQKHRAELVKHQDDMLDFLLQIPFEMRQYIFPMLNEKKSVPKKIKTHPDILVWKGKRPTKIAKQFQNDEELLEFLPAQFYYFLAPEMWPEEGSPQSLESNPNQVLIGLMKSGQNETITSEKIVDLNIGLKLLANNLTPQQKNQLTQKEKPVYLNELFTFSKPELDSEFKKMGFGSTKEFAIKVDKITQAYRLYRKGQIPPKSQEQELVNEYFSMIPILFQKTVFENLIDKKLYSD